MAKNRINNIALSIKQQRKEFKVSNLYQRNYFL